MVVLLGLRRSGTFHGYLCFGACHVVTLTKMVMKSHGVCSFQNSFNNVVTNTRLPVVRVEL